ncbi:hypothetical protein ACMD2_24562 [Ananas comosus]|uniref:Uncharacterized protein n=1 Tax=Ananas comosus TaxID=4615 RepID=A0A199UZ20_ANACO|nr:hypothetical protein ACMD2_24562 [Ananas comosus]
MCGGGKVAAHTTDGTTPPPSCAGCRKGEGEREADGTGNRAREGGEQQGERRRRGVMAKAKRRKDGEGGNAASRGPHHRRHNATPELYRLSKGRRRTRWRTGQATGREKAERTGEGRRNREKAESHRTGQATGQDKAERRHGEGGEDGRTAKGATPRRTGEGGCVPEGGQRWRRGYETKAEMTEGERGGNAARTTKKSEREGGGAAAVREGGERKTRGGLEADRPFISLY